MQQIIIFSKESWEQIFGDAKLIIFYKKDTLR